jgi:methylthioribose-1-phosphate isomerase
VRDPLNALQWEDGTLWILDQRKLPGKIEWIRARNMETVARAIETLAVRGAPAIGVAAAYGVALAALHGKLTQDKLHAAIARLARTRPTGYNLFHALGRMTEAVNLSATNVAQRLVRLAKQIHREDARSCLAMAKHGFAILKRGERILTYCHTGALATGGIGTALGVIKHGHQRGKVTEVFACETRPLGQGARLTVWECVQAGVPVTLICDNMAAALMQSGRVTRVMVGADCIARNGDTSNKIGTLALANLARAYGIPFHVVAPTSTFDLSRRSGIDIPIEERSASELTRITSGLQRLRGYKVWNPSFDVTPGKLITSHITDVGVLRPPFRF